MLLEHGGRKMTLTQVTGVLGGLEVSAQDLHLVVDLAEFLVSVAIVLNVGAEPPVIKTINCIMKGAIYGFVSEKEVVTPKGHRLDQVGSFLGDSGAGIYVGNVGAAVGAVGVAVEGDMSCVQPLDPFGWLVHPQAHGDVKVNDAIIVLKPLWGVGKSLGIFFNSLLQGLDAAVEVPHFFLSGLLAVQHGFGKSFCQGEKGIMADVLVCSQDVEGGSWGIGVHLLEGVGWWGEGDDWWGNWSWDG
jgi:hypothetical protein